MSSMQLYLIQANVGVLQALIEAEAWKKGDPDPDWVKRDTSGRFGSGQTTEGSQEQTQESLKHLKTQVSQTIKTLLNQANNNKQLVLNTAATAALTLIAAKYHLKTKHGAIPKLPESIKVINKSKEVKVYTVERETHRLTVTFDPTKFEDINSIVDKKVNSWQHVNVRQLEADLYDATLDYFYHSPNTQKLGRGHKQAAALNVALEHSGNLILNENIR